MTGAADVDPEDSLFPPAGRLHLAAAWLWHRLVRWALGTAAP